MSIFDIVYPKRCVGCNILGQYICDKCKSGVCACSNSLCYSGVVRKIIKEVKYRGSFDMISSLISLWQEKTNFILPDKQNWVITAVPMWREKKGKRGFNQAELLAREIAKRNELPYDELLIRTRSTKAMYGLNNVQRQLNITNAFAVNSKHNIPKSVILVDDVVTSGATTNECKRVLVDKGAEEVVVIAIAR